MSHYSPEHACIIVSLTKQYVNPYYTMNICEINQGLNNLLSGQDHCINNKELQRYKPQINNKLLTY